MSNFDLAIPILLRLEGDGQIANDKDDPGSLTKFGISKRYYPHVDIANLTRAQAIEIYREDWWIPIYEQMPFTVATKTFVLATNMGAIKAHICLQYAILACSGIPLLYDGRLGPATVAALTHCNEDALLAALKSEAAGYYRLKVQVYPNRAKFLKGWLARAYL